MGYARRAKQPTVGQFQYRAADAEGKVVEGTIEAPEQRVVVARLQDRGLVPIRVVLAVEKKASVAGGCCISRPFDLDLVAC